MSFHQIGPYLDSHKTWVKEGVNHNRLATLVVFPFVTHKYNFKYCLEVTKSTLFKIVTVVSDLPSGLLAFLKICNFVVALKQDQFLYSNLDSDIVVHCYSIWYICLCTLYCFSDFQFFANLCSFLIHRMIRHFSLIMNTKYELVLVYWYSIQHLFSIL